MYPLLHIKLLKTCANNRVIMEGRTDWLSVEHVYMAAEQLLAFKSNTN